MHVAHQGAERMLDMNVACLVAAHLPCMHATHLVAIHMFGIRAAHLALVRRPGPSRCQAVTQRRQSQTPPMNRCSNICYIALLSTISLKQNYNF